MPAPIRACGASFRSTTGAPRSSARDGRWWIRATASSGGDSTGAERSAGSARPAGRARGWRVDRGGASVAGSRAELLAHPLAIEAGGGEGADDERDVLFGEVLRAVSGQRDLDAARALELHVTGHAALERPEAVPEQPGLHLPPGHLTGHGLRLIPWLGLTARARRSTHEPGRMPSCRRRCPPRPAR